MAAPKNTVARSANLTLRLNPAVRETLNQLSAREGVTQTAVLERLITTAWENPEGYYTRSAAINAFTAAALARVTLGIVAGDRTQLMDALHVVDNVAKGLFGELPPPPVDARGMETSDSRVEALLATFGFFDDVQ